MSSSYWAPYSEGHPVNQLVEPCDTDLLLQASWPLSGSKILYGSVASECSSSAPGQLRSHQVALIDYEHTHDMSTNLRHGSQDPSSLAMVLEGDSPAGSHTMVPWHDISSSRDALCSPLDTASHGATPLVELEHSVLAQVWSYNEPGPSAPTRTTNAENYENSLTYALVERPRATQHARSRSVSSSRRAYSDDSPSPFDGFNNMRTKSSSPPRTMPTKSVNRRRPRAKIYPCPMCEKMFDRPSALATHQHAHTGEQPYSCPLPGCDRRFSVQSNARRHALTHEKPKPRPLKIAFEAPVIAKPSPLLDNPALDVKWAEDGEP